MASRLLTGGECPQGILDVVEGTIGYLAFSVGYTSIEYAALRVLSNLFFSFVEDLSVSSLMYAESSGRTSILLSDLVLGLIDLGFDVNSLDELPRKRLFKGCKEPAVVGASNKRGVACASVIGPGGNTIIPRPLSFRSNWPGTARFGGMGSVVGCAPNQASSEQLTSALPPPAPAHIQLPVLPEPHTFLQTQVKRPPVATDPASLRRRTADQRRKVQQSLIHFLARVQPVQYLFPGDPESFILLKPRKSSRPYITALMADSGSTSESRSEKDDLNQSLGLLKSKSSSTMRPTPTKSSTNDPTNPYLMRPKFPEY